MFKLKDKKSYQIIIVVAIAVIAAITACILIYSFLSPARTTVYMFNNAYEAGTKISGNMLTPMQVDSNMIVAGNKTDTSTHFVTSDNFKNVVSENDVLKIDVDKGDCFMTSMLSSQSTNRIALRMDPKSVAVTIPVSSTTGVSNSIKAESRVNVYVTYNSGGTYLILENVRILSVTTKDGSVTGYTLELDNQNAVKVIDAINTGSIYCGLTNGDGYVYETQLDVPVETKPIS